MNISSRLNTVNSILVPLLFVSLIASMAILIMLLSFEDVKNGRVDSILKTPIYGSAILFGVIIGTIIHYLKTCKNILIDNLGIKFHNIFKTEFVLWSDVKKIELIGKSQLIISPADASKLTLKDGRQIDILSSYYANMPTIRTSLEQVIDCLTTKRPIELKPKTNVQVIDNLNFVRTHGMTKFSGNHFLSFNGILIYGWILTSIYIVYVMPNSGAILIALTFMFGFIYGSLGLQLHYFYIDENYLVVKNHVWPWVNDKYRIENIKQVIFEIPYKRSTSLRVITKNYKSKLYSGGSLRDNTWKTFLQSIQNLNIDTINEAIY